MRIVFIPKGYKKFRTVYVPSLREKVRLRHLLGKLQDKEKQLCGPSVHGFIKGRSPVTNAMAHVGYAYSLCFDLKDFFESVTAKTIGNKLSKDEKRLVLVDGAARQGLPTSPTVANIAAADMDAAILKWRDKHDLSFVYTRYADDLTFSFNEPAIADKIKSMMPMMVGRFGFKLNEKKTKLQAAQAGNRIITGIAVNKDGIHPTREVRRKLRAALHQKNKCSANGLREWASLKLPNKKDAVKELEKLCKHWSISAKHIPKFVNKPTERYGNVVISGDPVYMLGMSMFTKVFSSCMAHPTGSNRRTTIALAKVKGVRVAFYEGNRDVTHGGVTRKEMLARVLVYEMEDGKHVYSTFYGAESAKAVINKQLNELGYISYYHARGFVVGKLPSKCRYLENVRWHNGRLHF